MRRKTIRILYCFQVAVTIACLIAMVLFVAGCRPGSATPAATAPAGPDSAPTPRPIAPAVISSYQEAVKASAASGKPMLLVFSASWCGPCRQLHAGTLNDPAVRAAIAAGYVYWEIDVDRDRELKRQYDVHLLPSYLVASSNEKPSKRGTGYRTPAAFLDWLHSAHDLAD